MFELLWVEAGIIIVCAILFLISGRPINPEKILRVDFLGSRDQYRTGYAKNGFSWGNDGFRTYYTKTKGRVHTYGRFRITYKTGYVRTIWSRAGTAQCKGLIEFIERQEAEKRRLNDSF